MIGIQFDEKRYSAFVKQFFAYISNINLVNTLHGRFKMTEWSMQFCKVDY